MSWFAVHTRPRAEFAVVEGFKRFGLDAYCPGYETTVRHARRTYDVLRPYFSRYVFLREEPNQPRWAEALSREWRERLGISAIVYAGMSALRVPDSEIMDLQEREELGWPGTEEQQARLIQPGDRVLIKVGRFADFIATVAKVDGPAKVRLYLDLFGRQVSATAPAGGLEIVSPIGAAA